MIIALASPRVASTLDDGLDKVERLQSVAASQGAEIVCFPEAYIPGLRGQDFDVFPFEKADHDRALTAVAESARKHAIATIIGMERISESGRQIAAYVIDGDGELRGYQTKYQLDPTEDQFYIPGDKRQIFEINRVKFGIAICHEGFRYPETVRWAATRGAKIVFHPHLTGAEKNGAQLSEWAAANAPYYEHTMEGPDDMPAHIKASLLGSSLSIPITSGKLHLGRWQGIYLCEHRDRGGSRELVVTIHGES